MKPLVVVVALVSGFAGALVGFDRMMNCMPVSQVKLESLNESHMAEDVEAILGSPTVREGAEWRYSQCGMWTSVTVRFSNDGHFGEYDVDR